MKEAHQELIDTELMLNMRDLAEPTTRKLGDLLSNLNI